MADTDLSLDPLDHDAVEEQVRRAFAAFEAARDPQQLADARREFLGDGAPLVLAHRAIGSLERSRRAQAGRNVGQAHARVAQALRRRESELASEREARALREETVDVTVPTERRWRGARHPIELMKDEIADFFVAMGWDIAEGPEIEHEWFNFDSLNFDVDHPARQMQDTFYIDGRSVGGRTPEAGHLVMRTHTSPVQSRAMLARGVPVYVACPGKVFRSDALDASHTPVFHQVEGLAVDRHLTMAHLKGTLDHFARAMFGPQARTRLRPSYFPFTEPSAEMDLWFPQKKGGPGWIEWGGCGMVNPHVLIANGVDPARYTGFAFGMGVERTIMLRHGISDMHDIVEGDVRFTQQFGLAGRGR